MPKTLFRAALAATTAALLSGCSSMPSYLAWTQPDTVEVRPLETPSRTAAVRRAKAMLERIVAESGDTAAAADAQAILNRLPAD